MKMYSSPTSPFGARVTIAASAKGIAIECIRPTPGMLRSAEYLAINPVGKIPVLLTESGDAIPESEAILGYLEDRFPQPSLQPATPEQRARMNVLIRMMDTYVMVPVIRLFPHLDPARRDEWTIGQEITRWKDGLAALAHFMKTPLPAGDAGISLADCVLPPSLHLCTRIAAMLGLDDDPATAHDSLVAYSVRMKSHPVVGPVLTGLTAAQEEYDLAAGRPSVAARH